MQNNIQDNIVQRTPETNEAYIKRAATFWKSAALDREIESSELQPLDFLIWVGDLLFTLNRASSRRVYLAAVRQWLRYLRENKIAYGGGLKNLEEAIKESELMQAAHYKTKSNSDRKIKNTSSQKQKSVDLVELFNLEDELMMINNKKKGTCRKWTDAVFTFMTANVMVGLRPCEWRRAYTEYQTILVDGKERVRFFLTVYNAKNTHGRSHGEKRSLNISELSKYQIQLIEKQILLFKEHAYDDKSWRKYYKNLQEELYRITRNYLLRESEFPFYPSLYSTRHQFVANAKLAGFNDVEVAAMMGHATDLTASLNYAQMHTGVSGFNVKPSLSDTFKIKLVKNKRKQKSHQAHMSI